MFCGQELVAQRSPRRDSARRIIAGSLVSLTSSI
jgi:hypothetical protein